MPVVLPSPHIFFKIYLWELMEARSLALHSLHSCFCEGTPKLNLPRYFELTVERDCPGTEQLDPKCPRFTCLQVSFSRGPATMVLP